VNEPAWLWAVVLVGIVALIAADTYFFDRGSREISAREAIVASLMWIGLAVLFGIGVWLIAGWPNAEEYFSAYLLEKGMAVDNLFVITMILAYFAVPRRYQYRVLFDPWGLSVTLVFRAGLIVLGIAALNHFRWALYVLGAFVVIAGVRLASNPRAVIHPERNPFLRLLGRLVPIGHEYHGESYLVRMSGRLTATPLLAALVVIETSEFLFALDSIPTVLGVTDKAFLVFTSNALALLGLRSLYFLLSRVIVRLTYVRVGVAIVMIFIGVKLILTDVVHVEVWESLAVVAIIILASAVASVVLPMLTGPRSGDRLAGGASTHVENLPGD
jgi:tellurite resistance protein TerC